MRGFATDRPGSRAGASVAGNFQAIDLDSAYLAAFAFCHFGAIGGGNPVSAGQLARSDSISGAIEQR